MPSKLCHICGSLVRSNEWPAHLRRHRDDKSERSGGSRPWRRLRERILDRDGRKCTICGSTESLEIHHINGDWRDDRPSNLQTVCFDHNPRGRGS